jgi:hypothetical protein
MSDNVVKFRKLEKKPEPPDEKPRRPVKNWQIWAALVVIAILLTAVQGVGFFVR